jgi:antitoxin component of RelBE/YafQ-DinJ toxin-antitoxin module
MMIKRKKVAVQSATINVRLPHDLKQGGDRVLKEAGVSPSELIRNLYRYMQREQEIPRFSTNDRQTAQRDETERKRELIRSLVGILPPDVDFDEMKRARLQRQVNSGVRT